MTFDVLLEKIVFPLAATFTGAFLAFRYQHSIERDKEKRAVVQVLMAYRNVAADELKWIEYMNIIDIVFHDNERVRQLYDKYLDCVGDTERFITKEHVDVYYEMVYCMCQDCGYKQIMQRDVKRNVYSPTALEKHYPRNEPAYPFYQGAYTKESAVIIDEESQYGLA